MVNENLIPKTEMVYELKNEIPSYEEFLKSYKRDELVEKSYQAELEAQSEINSLKKVCGPCSQCKNSSLAFKLEIILKNSRGGRAWVTVHNVDDAYEVASEIVREVGF